MENKILLYSAVVGLTLIGIYALHMTFPSIALITIVGIWAIVTDKNEKSII